jgi:hypothetical protein
MEGLAMGQILNRSATTTESDPWEPVEQYNLRQESLISLSKRYSINPKNEAAQLIRGISENRMAKWKRRTSVSDLPTSPKDAKSTTLSIEEEAFIVAFRWHTLLQLDDCLYALQATTPVLTRSSLHCFCNATGLAGCLK